MSFFSTLIKKILGDPHTKLVAPLWPVVEEINALEPEISALSDTDLKQKTTEFKTRIAAGETLDDLLPEAFAVVREASKRILGMRHFDVQLIGGMILHQGKIAEMRTGEGKTLVSTLATYLNALEGKGVYVVTVNDYLAKRDSQWMGKLFGFLGMTTGLVVPSISPQARIQAYACDITYGTNNEFGFDYLRDNLAYEATQCCQTRRHFAIIDEVDSILIDEARTPLIISGPVQDSTHKYAEISKIIKKLEKETDFTIDEKHKNAVLTEIGVEKIEKAFNLDSIYSVDNMDIAHMAVQCLKALHLYRRDVEYVVKEGEVLIVDEFTGRILEGRRYSDGLHQAIEAIENLSIKEESQTLATITFQNYFRMFPKLAGMTGTALTEEAELGKIYNLEVVPIPTNRSMVRQDLPDIVYKTKDEKFKAIIAEIQTLYEKGQPVLVGTISIENSEILSGLLKRKNIPHSVLNAKYHEKEADIISQAGQAKTITIATNMAGRGTDIMLGDGVHELGGLYVIGTERHESRRIDNQLRGRSGRQGDPGTSRFYVSLEDELMKLFGSDRIASVMDKLGLPADTPIEHPLITKSIEKAQSKVEKYYFGLRKQILEYDDVMNRQRETIYSLRRSFLENQNLDDKIQELLQELVTTYYAEHCGSTKQEEQDIEGFLDRIEGVFPVRELEIKPEIEAVATTLLSIYQHKKQDYPERIFEEIVTKRIFLGTLDRKWVDHLHQMEALREGIGLRAWGQKDPLIEYKMEAFDMFQALWLSIVEESFQLIYRASLVIESHDNMVLPDAPDPLETYDNRTEVSQPITKTEDEKTQRNELCPCGSGKKYKKCCMK